MSVLNRCRPDELEDENEDIYTARMVCMILDLHDMKNIDNCRAAGLALLVMAKLIKRIEELEAERDAQKPPTI